jgi:hypothetical protein
VSLSELFGLKATAKAWNGSYPPTRGKPYTDVASSKVGIGETAQSEKEKPGFITLEAKTLEIHEEATMLPIK